MQHAFIFQHLPPSSHSIYPRGGPTILLGGLVIHTCVLRGTPPKMGEGKAAPLPPIGQAGRRGRPMRGRGRREKMGMRGRGGEGRKEGDFLSVKHHSSRRGPPSPPPKNQDAPLRGLLRGSRQNTCPFPPLCEPKFSRFPSLFPRFCPKPDTKHVRAPTPPTQA